MKYTHIVIVKRWDENSEKRRNDADYYRAVH